MRATKKGVHLATSVTNTQQRGLGAKKKNPEVIAWGKKSIEDSPRPSPLTM